MQNIKTKLQKIYIPFLLVSIGTILVYSILRWIFDIKLGIIPLKEDLLSFWLPFILSFIVIYIWLRKRVRIIKIVGRYGEDYFGIQLIMSLTIAITFMISQYYLVKSSYNLHEINTVSEVENLTNEKYFKIANFQVDHNFNGYYVTSRVTGRNSEDLDVAIFHATLFQNSNSVWYGVSYKESLRNRDSEDQKNRAFKTFSKRSEKEFDNYNFQDVTYFEKLNYSDDRDGFLNGIKKEYPAIKKDVEIILIPKKGAFEDRMGYSLLWIFIAFSIGSAILIALLLVKKINKKALNDFNNNKLTIKADDTDFVIYLNPFGKHKAAAILLLVNCIAFAALLFAGLNIMHPTAKELLDVGGNRRFEVLNGEYWRLFTSMFIHGGISHLFMNAIGIGFACSFLEDKLSIVRLIVIYIVCGLLASVASIWWYENTISVGASGAIFGLYGVMAAFMIFRIYPSHMKNTIWSILGLFGGISLLLGLAFGADNAAHFGGLISGFVIGGILSVVYRTELQKRKKSR